MTKKMLNPVPGFKVLGKDYTNMYGKTFEVGKDYLVGDDSMGYHFGSNLFTALAFSEIVAKEKDAIITQITAYPTTLKPIMLDEAKAYYSDYYGIENIYIAPHIRIEGIVPREEIIASLVQASEIQVPFYLSNLNLTDVEIGEYLKTYQDNFSAMRHLLYYQFNEKDIYAMSYGQSRKRIKGVVDKWTKLS